MRIEDVYSNPLWWVQFHLQGGRRRQLGTIAIYMALALAGAVVTLRISPGFQPPRVAAGWLLVISMIQIGVLLMVGSGGVRRAIQRDFTTTMIESHRISPMSGLTAAIGYVIGPNLLTLVVFACGLVAGTGFCLLGGFPAPEWWRAMGALFCLAIMLWGIVAVLSISTNGTVNVMMIGTILAVTLGRWIVPALPGLGLLGGLTYWGIGERGLTVRLDEVAGGAMALQAAVVALCLAGIARKYRRPDIRAFPPGLALLLLMLVTVIGGLGLHFQNAWAGPWGNFLNDIAPPAETQLLCSILAGALFAMMPISAVAQVAADRSARDSRLSRCALVVGITATATAVVVGGYWYGVSTWERLPDWLDGQAWIRVGLLLGLGLLPIGAYMWIWYRTRDRVLWPTLIFVLVFWVVPPLADAIRTTFAVFPTEAMLTWITGISPAGALLLLWTRSEDLLPSGLAVQGVLAAMWWALAWYVSRPARPSAKLTATSTPPPESTPPV